MTGVQTCALPIYPALLDLFFDLEQNNKLADFTGFKGDVIHYGSMINIIMRYNGTRIIAE